MKRILLVIAAIAAVATAAVWFAAGESYVTTVKATVGTGLDVTAHGEQDYGLLFGQEVRVGAMQVQINNKAKADANLTGVNYSVGCNDGPTTANASSICGNLVITDSAGGKLVVGGTQSTTIRWTFTAPDCEDSAQKKDSPKTVPCSQIKNWDLSGEVFIGNLGYQGSTKTHICDKKTDGLVNGTSGAPILDSDGNQLPCP